MARPRSLTDASLLDAALVIMARNGPDSLTFAALAASTGLAAATLVQRFGSKPALVKAALLHAWDGLDRRSELAAAATGSTPDGAVALLVTLSGDDADAGVNAADTHADGLMILREDFRDDDLRARGQRWGQRLQALIAPRLAGLGGRTAAANDDAARELIILWQGAILWWGFQREGTVASYVERILSRWLEQRR
ncbi:MAG TPA: helix-turn-helix domain-containing protein [Kaistia sp.]|nr:helix-turn-helix domain-containing protein [Kaistia sp.]